MTTVRRVAHSQRGALQPPDQQPSTARLAGAGSRQRELQALLRVVQLATSTAELRTLVLRDNVTGKGSAASREKVWGQLRARYVLDPAVEEYRAFLGALQNASSPREEALLCFLMVARTDRLFREVVLDQISPHLHQERVVAADDVQAAIRRLVAPATWRPSTVTTVQQHVFSALKDFGLLRGTRTRRTARPQPGTQVAIFAARLGRLEGLTDRQVLEGRWFRLLGLQRDQVVDLLYTAGRHGALDFRMQADVVELRLPALAAA